MTPISKDPKRRIRRILRYLEACGGIPECLNHGNPKSKDDDAIREDELRIDSANELLAAEIEWLSKYALRITTDHGRATSRLGEIEGALRRIGAAVHEISPHVSPCSTPDTLAYEVESACRIVEDSRDMKKRKP